MVAILVVVFIVMLLFNGAMYYVLRTGTAITAKQVRACFVKELESYNDFLNRKKQESREIEAHNQQLHKEIDDMEGILLSLKTSPFYAPRQISRELFVPIARYIDDDFFDNHKIVNDLMRQMDKGDTLVRVHEKNAYEGDMKAYLGATKILSMLDTETLYEFCTIPNKDQIPLLRSAIKESVGESEERLLDDFLATLDWEEEFDVLDFVTHLRERRTENDPKMYVRTGSKEEEDFPDVGTEIVRQYDKNISEGLKVIYQNRLFDFSIYRARSKK